jgi:deoxyguanosine kinase
MCANESSSAKRAPVPERAPQSPRFIVIEGPLRVGKSTLAGVLAERLHARRVYDCEDNPFLADFYNEKPGSALRAQMYFLIERQKRLREALAIESPGPILSDFLMEKDRIFANLNLNDQELKLYNRYYETLTMGIPAPDLVIYLQAKPEVLQTRIAKKAAREETQIADEYIEEVARAYEHFFFHYAASDLLVINTSDIDFVESSADLQQLLRRLQDPVKGTQYFLPLGAAE